MAEKLNLNSVERRDSMDFSDSDVWLGATLGRRLLLPGTTNESARFSSGLVIKSSLDFPQPFFSPALPSGTWPLSTRGLVSATLSRLVAPVRKTLHETPGGGDSKDGYHRTITRLYVAQKWTRYKYIKTPCLVQFVDHLFLKVQEVLTHQISDFLEKCICKKNLVLLPFNFPHPLPPVPGRLAGSGAGVLSSGLVPPALFNLKHGIYTTIIT